jgi:hypothetical protein
MRHAQLFFDSYAPQDQSPPELAEKSLAILPEVYFSATSMKVLYFPASLMVLIRLTFPNSYSRLSSARLED